MTSLGGEAMLMMNLIHASSGTGYPSTLLPTLSPRSYYQRYLLQKTTCRDNVFEGIKPMHHQLLSIPLSTPKMPNDNESKEFKRKKKHKPCAVWICVVRRLCQVKKGSILRYKEEGDSSIRMTITRTSFFYGSAEKEIIDEETTTIKLSPRVSMFQQEKEEEEEVTLIAPATILSSSLSSSSLLLSVSNNSSNDCDDW